MGRAEDEYRTVLLEAFTAGWQAALAVRITHPRVLAVVEDCYDRWLEEAVDEMDVLGLRFRRRRDLPRPRRRTARGPALPAGRRRAGGRNAPPAVFIPGQRRPDDPVAGLLARPTGRPPQQRTRH